MKKQKCSYAKKYKAVRAPTCGCEFCMKVWLERSKK